MKNRNKIFSNIPEKVLFFCLSVTAAIIIVLGWFNWTSYKNSQTFINRDFRLQQLSSVVIHLDEVLTMSARLGAASGDVRWEKRYLEFENKLDSAIKEIRSISPEAFITENAALTDSANIKLVKAEHQAFRMIHDGDLDSATQLLFSKEYEKNKEIYSEGMINIGKALHIQAQSQIERQRRQGILSLTFLIISLLMLAIVWIGAFRIMKRYLFEKNQANKLLKEQNEEYIALNKELQTAKEKAEESEEKFRTIFEQAPLGIAMTHSFTGKFKDINPRFSKIAGRTAEEMLSIDWMSITHPDDVQPDLDNMELLNTQTIKGYQMEKRYILPNGEYVWINMIVAPLPVGDKSNPYHLCMIDDITERKQSEQVLKESESRYKSIFYENKSIMLIIDPKTGRIIDANNSSIDYYGYSKEELLSLNITNINVLPKAQVGHEMQNALKEKKNYFEFKHKLANGDIRDVHAYSGKIEIDKKTFLYSIIHDITAQRVAEDALKASEKQLRELNATKDKLFSIIAHDLRSPFNSILGFSELLIENVKDFKVAESEMFLGLIYSSAKNTLILLDNLLNWAKTQTGKIIIQPEKIILSSIIQETIEISNSAAKIKNIAIKYNQSDEVEVYADKDMLKTVLRNLISNAIKFTKSGGDVNVFVISKHNKVEISISDNGVGINDETRKKLFDASINLTSWGTANEKGSGLGLVLCKEFVEKLGGNIWVESEEGKGSDFKFTLPLKKS